MVLVLDEFEPIFGEPRVEWTNSCSGQAGRFLFHVYAQYSSQLRINVTDFQSNTWEAKRSVSKLEDMRDVIGLGGSWSEFIEYVIASVKSEDVKLLLEGHSDSDGITNAKLVAQKSRGMPVISFTLGKLVGPAASEAMANLSLGLFEAFKSTQLLLLQEQERSCQLGREISAKKERNDNMQSQLEQYSTRQKLLKMNSSEKAEVSAPLIHNSLQASPDKPATKDPVSTKVSNRVIPAYKRAKVRGALLQDIEDDQND